MLGSKKLSIGNRLLVYYCLEDEENSRSWNIDYASKKPLYSILRVSYIHYLGEQAGSEYMNFVKMRKPELPIKTDALNNGYLDILRALWAVFTRERFYIVLERKSLHNTRSTGA